MPNRVYQDDRFEYEEVQEQGFIRTMKRPKAGPVPLTPEERLAALEADVAQINAQIKQVLNLK